MIVQAKVFRCAECGVEFKGTELSLGEVTPADGPPADGPPRKVLCLTCYDASSRQNPWRPVSNPVADSPVANPTTIDDLNLSEQQKAKVLSLLAFHLWQIQVKLGIQDGSYKPAYDPLHIDLDQRIAWTYVFDLWTGGRRHPFESLAHIEEALVKETIAEVRQKRVCAREQLEGWLRRLDGTGILEGMRSEMRAALGSAEEPEQEKEP